MKDNFKLVFYVSAVLFFCLLIPEKFHGDTIIKRDRERVKGVIVEEYKDRVVISTIDGEQNIMKNEIERISYDLEEQNLTRMGDLYQDRGMYNEAYHYYSQALKINPQYKSAREGLDYSGSMLQQFGRKMKLEHINRMNEEKAWRSGVRDQEESMESQLKRVLGFSLEPYGANFKVIDVQMASPAYDAKLKIGDVIIAVWGRMVGYTRPEEVMEKVVSPEVMEVRLTILRTQELAVKNVTGNLSAMIGAGIGYSENEGFEVISLVPGGTAETAGLVVGDTIAEIDGESTRYMAMKEMEKMFSDKKGSTINIGVKRDLSLWKNFDKK